MAPVVAILLGVLAAPLARLRLPRGQRIIARLVTTGMVMFAWFVAGTVAWRWDATSYAVVGVISVIALVLAASPRT